MTTHSAATHAALAAIVLIGLTACRSEEGVEPMTIEVSSTAFADGQPIPAKYAEDGPSPPLAWSNLPDGTQQLALICDDPDAPSRNPWVHWVIYKIPADIDGLPEAVPPTPRLAEPAGALQGENSWTSGQTIGYRGPAPPPGHGRHRYFFALYALDTELVVEEGKDKETLLEAMSGHILAKGRLMGTYER